MRIVIHAGMHKTGSSSIQDYMGAQTDEEIVYARWASSNHCGLFVLLFQDPELIVNYHGFKARGAAFLATLPELRAKWRQSIIEDLERSRDKTFVFSAEDISWPQFQLARKNMHDFFRSWSDDITVVGYVRDPLSFAVSAFQQRLKGGMTTFAPHTHWPEYEGRFAQMDELFGRDKVILRPYDRSQLHGGDVVADFAAILGTEFVPDRNAEANTSLSAEATALLFLQRNLGDGYVAGFPTAPAGNQVFIEALRRIGSRRYTFAEKIWDEVKEQHRSDLDWIEERLGQKLPERRPADALVISSGQDLLDLAVSQLPEAEALLMDVIRQREEPAIQKTRRVLDLLRQASY
ncbi:hypothetical protein [Paenirhodobacter hankyongi]|uniref:Sulfotransferase family protein n=1 Tax=Paenirhodobacter hankyongi TaxID=2294033 RepID=A0A421BSN0_9RHOB|nr:hypothetical protein [Sinirhodobacter hankyongi]RLL71287.1 hypothetical protein DYS74_05250 [Sinirhodobacter hankyongi]